MHRSAVLTEKAYKTTSKDQTIISLREQKTHTHTGALCTLKFRKNLEANWEHRQ